MHGTELRRLCVDLQSAGVRMPPGIKGRRGGAGPSEGRALAIQGHTLNVPVNGWYVAASPYRLVSVGDELDLYRDGQQLVRAELYPRPAFYDLRSPDGTPFEKMALVHGRDCLGSTVYQDCRYRTTGMACAFCGIGLSLSGGRTILDKAPDVLAEVARQARLRDHVRHVTLTSGARQTAAETFAHLARCSAAIKAASGLPIHVQVSPVADFGLLEQLRDAGVDTLGMHIETWDEQVRQRICPGKGRIAPDVYLENWQRAVALFGRGQVSTFLLAGLGETPESLVAGAAHAAAQGVFPYVLPHRPVPGTPLETLRPPSAAVMDRIYADVAAVLRDHGLASHQSRAGCVRCGACSCLGLYERRRR